MTWPFLGERLRSQMAGFSGEFTVEIADGSLLDGGEQP